MIFRMLPSHTLLFIVYDTYTVAYGKWIHQYEFICLSHTIHRQSEIAKNNNKKNTKHKKSTSQSICQNIIYLFYSSHTCFTNANEALILVLSHRIQIMLVSLCHNDKSSHNNLAMELFNLNNSADFCIFLFC